MPLRRRSRPAPRNEIAGLVNDARRDATAYALERLAEQVERTLVAPAGRVRLTVSDPPRQPRSRGPLVAILGVVVLAIVAAVVILVGGRGDGGDLAATTTSVVPPTTPFVSATQPPAEGFSTPVVADGLQITPRDPATGFGLSCIIWDVAGPTPLTFDPAGVTLTVEAGAFPVDPTIEPGRAPAAIDATAASGTVETCFQVGDAVAAGMPAELRYLPPGATTTPYRWQVSMR